MSTHDRTHGFTLIEILIAVAIFGFIASTIYFAYTNVLDIVSASQYHAAATDIIEGRVEMVRNMRYEDVGTIGGIPAGKLPETETITLDATTFDLTTTVRNVDDPFDGTMGGSPNDTSPADYKLVQFQVSCPACRRFNLGPMTTIVAPRNLENVNKYGALEIKTMDASGFPVSGARVTIVNSSVTPAVNTTQTTDNAGILFLTGVATSSAGYEVTVTKNGYSTERTYTPNDPANPNPVNPHLTVAAEQLTIASFAIDRTGSIAVSAVDQFCSPVQGLDFHLGGRKLVGTQPDIVKYDHSFVTGTDGSGAETAAEWDTYELADTDASWDIGAMSASLSFTLDPTSSYEAKWFAAPAASRALLVRVVDQDGATLDDANVRVVASGYDHVQLTGRYETGDTTWASISFSGQSGGIDSTTQPDDLVLANVAGHYPSGSWEWLESRTLDLGISAIVLHSLSWSGDTPPETGIRFQLAANNDGTSWTYIGPDGTDGTYFTSPPATPPAALNGNRYIRYRAYLQTLDTAQTPVLYDVTMTYSSGCLPSGFSLFGMLPSGLAAVTVQKAGFVDAIASASMSEDWQQITVTLHP